MSEIPTCGAPTQCGHGLEWHRGVTGCADGCECTWMPTSVSEPVPELGVEPPFTTPAAERLRAAPSAAAMLSTPCATSGHSLNWHRNNVGCTVVHCACGRYQDPAVVPVPDTERRDRYAAAICAAEGHDWEEIKASYPDDAAEYLRIADAALAVANEEQQDLISRLGEYADRAIANGQEAAHWRTELDLAEAYPTEVSYLGEIQEICDQWGYLVADRNRAVVEKRLAKQRERFPDWADGAPVRTRTVTKTTTYTLATPAVRVSPEEPLP